VPILAALLLLAASTWAAEIPSGPLPKIDGEIETGEWSKAEKSSVDGATLHVQIAPGALCIAVSVSGPYDGERLDLLTSDAAGKVYARHSFHPRCYWPKFPHVPLPPIAVYRSSFKQSAHPLVDNPTSCRVRTHFGAKAWSIEIAISLETTGLNQPGDQRFHLELRDPFGSRRLALTPITGESKPSAWRAFHAASSDPVTFSTPVEDSFRSIEARIFDDRIQVLSGKTGSESLVRDALDGKKSNTRIDALLAPIESAIKHDPGDLFARYFRVYLLRRSNRLKDAAAALDAITTELPAAADLPPVLAERLEVLFSLGLFPEAVRTAKQLRLPPRLRSLVEISESSARFWQHEVALRAADKKRRADRIVFNTTKGEITVELFEGAAADFVRDAAKAKRIDAAIFEPVTGGVLANLRFDGKAPPPGAGTRDRRRHWRGSVGLTQPGPRAELYFTTKRTFWLDDDKHTVIGRVVAGMEFVDAIEFNDRVVGAIVAAREKEPK